MAGINHNSFLLYGDKKSLVDICTDEQAGQLFKAIFAFACDGEELETEDRVLAIAYSVFRDMIKLNDEKYTIKCNTYAENGRKGGLATAAKRQQMLANASDRLANSSDCLATASDCLASGQRNIADNDNDNVTDNVTDNENENVNGNDTSSCSELFNSSEPPKDEHTERIEPVDGFSKWFEEFGAELQDSSEPPEIVPDVPGIILNDGSDWYPTIEDVKGWEDLYPGVDVKREFAKMREWCINNPKKRKTKTGARKFVSTWLDREQNRVGSRQPQKDKYTQRIEDVDNWGSSFFDQMQDW